MGILRGCGLGTKLQRSLHWYWDAQKVIPKSENFFGRPFLEERGVTQGYTVSSKIFNIVVDALVRVVLIEVCRPQEAHHGFIMVGG